jgi:ABC-type multidrug transport system ATPase subunit
MFSSNCQPSNIKHHFSEFYQTIKEDMPFQNITIDELFRKVPREIIIESAKICCCDHIINDLRFDVKISSNRKLSGGEKSRIALATVVADCIYNNRQAFIADELEQGVDPELAYQIYENVRTRLSQGRQLWFVSHLEQIETKFEWTKIIKFTNGHLSISSPAPST